LPQGAEERNGEKVPKGSRGEGPKSKMPLREQPGKAGGGEVGTRDGRIKVSQKGPKREPWEKRTCGRKALGAGSSVTREKGKSYELGGTFSKKTGCGKGSAREGDPGRVRHEGIRRGILRRKKASCLFNAGYCRERFNMGARGDKAKHWGGVLKAGKGRRREMSWSQRRKDHWNQELLKKTKYCGGGQGYRGKTGKKTKGLGVYGERQSETSGSPQGARRMGTEELGDKKISKKGREKTGKPGEGTWSNPRGEG